MSAIILQAKYWETAAAAKSSKKRWYGSRTKIRSNLEGRKEQSQRGSIMRHKLALVSTPRLPVVLSRSTTVHNPPTQTKTK